MATTYMGLTLPTVSVTGGPTYATQLNTALTSIDSHNHVSGSGQQIPSAGLNINADLPFNLTGTAFNATGLRASKYISQGSTLGATDTNALYFSGGNLYINNGSGQAVQITSGAALSASSLGGISGLSAPAAASYASGTGTFTWTSNTNTAASMDNGPITIRDTAASAPGITIKNPVGIGGAYSITLPAAAPASTSFLTMSSAGVLTAGTALTGALTTTNLSASAGILGSQLATAAGITRGQLASVGQQISSSSGAFSNSGNAYIDVTNLSVTITTTGRPVMLMVVPDGSANRYDLAVSSASAEFAFDRGGSKIAIWYSGSNRAPIHIDPVGAGTYTYKFRVYPNSVTFLVNYMVLVAYEL